MTKPFLKIISLLLIVSMNWSAVSLICGTDAYFNDVEVSENNIFTAGVLDFELYSAADFSPEITPTQNSARTISIVDTTSTMNYNYKVRVENAVGSLCADLLLDDGNGSQALNSFISNEVLYSNKSAWIFNALLIGGSSGWEGESCSFDFIFEGWQDNIAFGTGGFSDLETISNVISNSDQPPVLSSCMKINEVYYDPGVRTNTSGTEGDPNDEWIELYNSCDYGVNIKDWYLEDNGGYDRREKLNHDYTIDGYQFVVIAANASTWTYWPNIPTNAFKIALGGTKSRMFTYGLANDGDVIILYDKDGNQIDEVSWGDDTTGLDPAVLGVADGHSISRKPKGYDTDAASDWMDTHSGSDPQGPNPGTNPHSEDGTLLLPPPPPPVAMSSTTPATAIPEPIIEPMTDDDDDEDEEEEENTNTDDDADKDTDTDTDDTTDTDTTGDDDIADDGDSDTTDDTTDGDDTDTTTDTTNGDTTDTDDTGTGTNTDDADDDTDDGDDTTSDVDTNDGDSGETDTGGEEETGEETKLEVGEDDTTGSTPEDGTGTGTDGDEDGDEETEPSL